MLFGPIGISDLFLVVAAILICTHWKLIIFIISATLWCAPHSVIRAELRSSDYTY